MLPDYVNHFAADENALHAATISKTDINKIKSMFIYLQLCPEQARKWFAMLGSPMPPDGIDAIDFRWLRVPISVRLLKTRRAPSRPTMRMPPCNKSTMP